LLTRIEINSPNSWLNELRKSFEFNPEKELAAGNTCPVHGTAVEWTSEENVFFRLSRYQQPLLDWYDAHPEGVRPASRLNEVRSFLEGGLKDLSVSRATVNWAIPFPGRPGQTIYVWLDALTNYLSALGFGREGEDGLYRRFWDHEGATRLHIVGKDILRFHAVFWPAFLLSAGLPLPTTVWAHGWWLRDGRKMSKSVGNVVRPDELVERFGADSLRFFVLREMVFGQDAQFSDEAFIDRFNSDLANDLGNTVSRAVTLSRSAFGGKTPPVPCDDNPLLATARQVVADYRAAMDELAFHRALESLWKLVAETNQYIVAREPWKLIKTAGASEALSHVLWNALEATRIVATALLPFLPRDAPRVLAAIGVATPPASLDALAWGGLPTNAPLPEPQPIFPRIDKKAYLESHVEPTSPESTSAAAPTANPVDVPPLDRPQITIDQFGALDLRVGTVRAAEAVPKSKKLLKLTVDIGVETRTVVAGIALAYQPDDLVGKQVVIVANLAPATLMGVESQGMVLAASIDGKPVVLHPAAPVPEGTRVK